MQQRHLKQQKIGKTGNRFQKKESVDKYCQSKTKQVFVNYKIVIIGNNTLF